MDTEKLQSERNASAKNIGKAKAQGEDIEPLLAAVKDLGDKLDSNEAELAKVRGELRDIELGLPNLLGDDVPAGNTEDDNTQVRRWGEPTELGFEAKITSRSANNSECSISTRRAAYRVPDLRSCAGHWRGCSVP